MRSAPATRVVIITPTRELAVQARSLHTRSSVLCARMLAFRTPLTPHLPASRSAHPPQIAQMGERLAQFTDIRIALVVGGLSLGVQAAALRTRPEIVVATPGRLIDHLRNTQSFGLDDLAALVLDEADRLLELGFADELAELLRLCPARRQTLLFSATLTPAVERLAALSLQSPARLSADGLGAAPATLTQEIVRVRPGASGDKEAIVLSLLTRAFAKDRVIAFARTKARAHRLKVVAGLVGIAAAELHGDMTQAQRLAVRVHACMHLCDAPFAFCLVCVLC